MKFFKKVNFPYFKKSLTSVDWIIITITILVVGGYFVYIVVKTLKNGLQ